MAMKSLAAGRKVYVRNDIIHIIAKGRQYAPAKNFTNLDIKGNVAVADVCDASVKVTQGDVSEIWPVTQVPSTPRKSKETTPTTTSLLPVQVNFFKGV